MADANGEEAGQYVPTDYYEALRNDSLRIRVSRTANIAEIQTAYEIIMKQWCPHLEIVITTKEGTNGQIIHVMETEVEKDGARSTVELDIAVKDEKELKNVLAWVTKKQRQLNMRVKREQKPGQTIMSVRSQSQINQTADKIRNAISAYMTLHNPDTRREHDQKLYIYQWDIARAPKLSKRQETDTEKQQRIENGKAAVAGFTFIQDSDSLGRMVDDPYLPDEVRQDAANVCGRPAVQQPAPAAAPAQGVPRSQEQIAYDHWTVAKDSRKQTAEKIKHGRQALEMYLAMNDFGSVKGLAQDEDVPDQVREQAGAEVVNCLFRRGHAVSLHEVYKKDRRYGSPREYISTTRQYAKIALARLIDRFASGVANGRLEYISELEKIMQNSAFDIEFRELAGTRLCDIYIDRYDLEAILKCIADVSRTPPEARRQMIGYLEICIDYYVTQSDTSSLEWLLNAPKLLVPIKIKAGNALVDVYYTQNKLREIAVLTSILTVPPETVEYGRNKLREIAANSQDVSALDDLAAIVKAPDDIKQLAKERAEEIRESANISFTESNGVGALMRSARVAEERKGEVLKIMVRKYVRESNPQSLARLFEDPELTPDITNRHDICAMVLNAAKGNTIASVDSRLALARPVIEYHVRNGRWEPLANMGLGRTEQSEFVRKLAELADSKLEEAIENFPELRSAKRGGDHAEVVRLCMENTKWPEALRLRNAASAIGELVKVGAWETILGVIGIFSKDRIAKQIHGMAYGQLEAAVDKSNVIMGSLVSANPEPEKLIGIALNKPKLPEPVRMKLADAALEYYDRGNMWDELAGLGKHSKSTDSVIAQIGEKAKRLIPGAIARAEVKLNALREDRPDNLVILSEDTRLPEEVRADLAAAAVRYYVCDGNSTKLTEISQRGSTEPVNAAIDQLARDNIEKARGVLREREELFRPKAVTRPPCEDEIKAARWREMAERLRAAVKRRSN